MTHEKESFQLPQHLPMQNQNSRFDFKKYRLHLLLFILTVFSTFFAGWGEEEGLTGAFLYSLGIMSILLSHEMGHFLMARRYGVPVTLPYFIPLPISPFGTMGAVIRMGGRIPSRRVLFDIGVAGPLAGMVFIIPAIVIGLRLSRIVEIDTLGQNVITLGDSLFFKMLAFLSIGPLEQNQDIILHPLAYAGWVGLFVTALNLLPIGQLDGGHILYALFHRKSKYLSAVLYGVFLYILLFHFAGWLLFIILLAIFHRHPPTVNDDMSLDFKRRILGGIVLLLFILSFTPVPFGFGKGLIPILQDLLK